MLAQERWAIFIEDAEPSSASCVTATELASSATALTGTTLAVLSGPPSEQSAPQVEHLVAGRLTRHNDQITLVLALHDASGALVGERVFERPEAQCAELRDAAVLAVAVMIGKGQPVLAEATPNARPAPAEPTAAEPSAAKPIEPKPEAQPKPPDKAQLMPADKAENRPATQLQLFAGAGAAGNVVPGLTAHALIAARLANALPWPLELSASFLGQGEADLGSGSNGRATFAPLYAVLTTCPLGASTGALHADACFGVLGGAALTSATDFTLRNPKSTQPLVGVVLQLPVSLRLGGPFVLRASASAGTPIIYSRVYAIDSELQRRKLTQTSPVFASVDLALGLELF